MNKYQIMSDLELTAVTRMEEQVEKQIAAVTVAKAALVAATLAPARNDAAIKALDDSAVQALPADVAAERTRLRSRALFELERPDEALRLISNDMTRDADLLRAEITWKTARWREASDVFGRLVGDGDAAIDLFA